jgi:hypothetical protein
MPQSRYQPFLRTELKDAGGNTLVVLVDTNGLSWKLYMVHNARWVDAAWYPTADGAAAAHANKVQEAESVGWRVEPSA